MVQSLITGEQGEQGAHGGDEEMKNEVIQNETFAVILQTRKGKGKGKGTAKKGTCWNCGETDLYSRDCPQ